MASDVVENSGIRKPRAWSLVATITVVLALLPLGSWSADAAALVARKSGCTILGGPGPDVLVGTSGDDVVCGRGGHDKLVGHGGDDELRGGRGDDEMIGGPGSDLVRGESGKDALTGGRGDDYLRGGRNDDKLDGRDASGFGLTFRSRTPGPPQGTYLLRRPGFTPTKLFVVPSDATRRTYQVVIFRGP